MHDVEAFNARLAVDYPAYSMVICQVKAGFNVYTIIFDQTSENDSCFRL